MKIALRIRANEGYSASQVKGITVGELRRWLEDYDDDTEIVTHDLNSRYGAAWGKIAQYQPLEDADDEDEDEA